MGNKVDFAGPAWVEAARVVLEDLVATEGDGQVNFSVCEIFTDAPKTVASTGRAAWYFYIRGREVTVGTGVVSDTDVTIRADYATALPGARLVYTPEVLADLAKQPPPTKPPTIDGDMSKAPPWLMALHNRLAVMTR